MKMNSVIGILSVLPTWARQKLDSGEISAYLQLERLATSVRKEKEKGDATVHAAGGKSQAFEVAESIMAW